MLSNILKPWLNTCHQSNWQQHLNKYIFIEKKPQSGKSIRKKKETSVYYMILQNCECH